MQTIIIPSVIGLIVGVIGFALLELVSMRARTLMLPALLLHIAVGTMLQMPFGTLGIFYYTAWLFANLVCVLVGFIRRNRH